MKHDIFTCEDIISLLSICYRSLYNNQINTRTLIGESAMAYYASKLMKIARHLNYYIKVIDHKFLLFIGYNKPKPLQRNDVEFCRFCNANIVFKL